MKKLIGYVLMVISLGMLLMGCNQQGIAKQTTTNIIKAEAKVEKPKEDYYNVRLSSYVAFQDIREVIDGASRAKERLPLETDDMNSFKSNYDKCKNIYDKLILLPVPLEYKKFNDQYMSTLKHFISVSQSIISNNKPFSKEECIINMEMSALFQTSNDGIFGIDNSKIKLNGL